MRTSDANQGRLIVGESVTFQVVNGSLYCAVVTDAETKDAPDTPGF